jgi:tight adherence protein B
MTPLALHLGLALLVAVAVIGVSWGVQSLPKSTFKGVLGYQARWDAELKQLHIKGRFRYVPIIQLILFPLSIALAAEIGKPLLFALPVAVAGLPPLILKRSKKRRSERFGEELDSFLTSLSDALTAVPNLGEAIASLHEHLEPPIRDEVGILLGEITLGSTIEDALRRMAARVNLPGLDAAVEAALLSHRVGGDLSHTLRRIASSIREMARLEGVVKTKTAEGRTQAWVMGSVPPGMVLVLEKMDPEWLAPLWNDPIGWIILGVAAILEVTAVVLIRRIMAVEL